MFCKFCGKELSDGVIFCSKCGKKLASNEVKNNEINVIRVDEIKATKFCKHCGKEVPISALFCSKCGAEVGNKSFPRSVIDNSDSPIIKDEVIVTNLKDNIIEDKSAEINIEAKSNENISILPDIREQEISNVEKIPVEKTVEFDTEQNKSELKNQMKTYSYAPIEEKFGMKNLFIQVFKKHTPKERDEILKAGLSGDVKLDEIKISQELFHPWLYSRIFLILLAVFVVCEICLFTFYNSNIMPGVMFMGSVMLPFTILTLYFELNIYKDISFFKVIGIFLLGGTLSLVFTLLLYEIIPTYDDYSFLSASLISIIEELGKGVIVIYLLKRTKNVTVLQGLLIGGAIGCGFAVFESAGYAFNSYLDAHDYNTRADIVNNYISRYSQYSYVDSWGEMNFTIILRSILSLGGHTAWAAITGAAFAREKKIDFDFIKMFAICFLLHALWDTDFSAWYLVCAVLCIAAWLVIIHQVSRFIEENKFREING